MRTSFVILHYLAEDVTCKCLDSLLSLKGGEDVSIVVVDNCSPDGSGGRLKRKYAAHDSVHFVPMAANEGFARGNNAGYRYAVEHFNPDFVVVMNNDVIIDDPDFVRRVEEEYANHPYAVLGPDIISAAAGKHQNPYRAKALSLNEARMFRLKMRLKLAFLPVFYALGHCDKPCFSEKEWRNASDGCVLHGACLVFSRDFIAVRQFAFNPGTFLYCEEDILNAECAKAGLVMRYSPGLKVKHLEDCSTRSAHKSAYARVRRKYRNLVRSSGVLARALGGPLGWFKKIIVYHFPYLLPDRKYLELKWKSKMGYELNLDAPVTFNEKIQWLKLNDRKKEYAILADKAAVKDYVASVIGREHVIPTIGVYGKADDIPFDSLPDQFVLKCTHDSGSVIVCRDRSSFDADFARNRLEKSLERNHYSMYREWCYKNIKPRILCERYLSDDGQADGLIDYKFFCFNGIPEFLYISKGLEDHGTACISFCDLDGQELPFRRLDFRTFPDGSLPLPEKFGAMKELVSLLAKSVANPFVRVDMYEISGTIYFSEFTFYPNGGFVPFCPREWDRKLGEKIILR